MENSGLCLEKRVDERKKYDLALFSSAKRAAVFCEICQSTFEKKRFLLARSIS